MPPPFRGFLTSGYQFHRVPGYGQTSNHLGQEDTTKKSQGSTQNRTCLRFRRMALRLRNMGGAEGATDAAAASGASNGRRALPAGSGQRYTSGRRGNQIGDSG